MVKLLKKIFKALFKKALFKNPVVNFYSKTPSQSVWGWEVKD